MDNVLTWTDYQPLALRTEKPMPHRRRLSHGMLGLITETGEICDAIKKHTIYSKELDIANIGEEFGDSMWYAAILCDAAGIWLADVGGKAVDEAIRTFDAMLRFAPERTERLETYSRQFLPPLAQMANLVTSYNNEVLALSGQMQAYIRTHVYLLMEVQLEPMEMLFENIQKLRLRYPKAYTDVAALTRADKTVSHHQV
jgi:NTP pyrophosphatase (non-canonical NTP hydrolase)